MFLTEAPFYLRILHSRRAWKLVKWVGLVAVVWFSVYQFKVNYQIINSDGIHGIVARKTLEAIAADSEKARAYDTIPDNYLSVPAASYGYPSME